MPSIGRRRRPWRPWGCFQLPGRHPGSWRPLGRVCPGTVPPSHPSPVRSRCGPPRLLRAGCYRSSLLSSNRTPFRIRTRRCFWSRPVAREPDRNDDLRGADWHPSRLQLLGNLARPGAGCSNSPRLPARCDPAYIIGRAHGGEARGTAVLPRWRLSHHGCIWLRSVAVGSRRCEQLDTFPKRGNPFPRSLERASDQRR
jgi:hypothetical protein